MSYFTFWLLPEAYMAAAVTGNTCRRLLRTVTGTAEEATAFAGQLDDYTRTRRKNRSGRTLCGVTHRRADDGKTTHADGTSAGTSDTHGTTTVGGGLRAHYDRFERRFGSWCVQVRSERCVQNCGRIPPLRSSDGGVRASERHRGRDVVTGPPRVGRVGTTVAMGDASSGKEVCKTLA